MKAPSFVKPGLLSVFAALSLLLWSCDEKSGGGSTTDLATQAQQAADELAKNKDLQNQVNGAQTDEQKRSTGTLDFNKAPDDLLIVATADKEIRGQGVFVDRSGVPLDKDAKFNVTVEEGAALPPDALKRELRLDALVRASSHAPVVIRSEPPVDLVKPMTVILSLPSELSDGFGLAGGTGTNLGLTADEMKLNLVVLYRVQLVAKNMIEMGALPVTDEHVSIKNGKVLVQTLHFGWFQALVLDRKLQEPVKVVGTTVVYPIQTKQEAANPPPPPEQKVDLTVLSKQFEGTSVTVIPPPVVTETTITSVPLPTPTTTTVSEPAPTTTSTVTEEPAPVNNTTLTVAVTSGSQPILDCNSASTPISSISAYQLQPDTQYTVTMCDDPTATAAPAPVTAPPQVIEPAPAPVVQEPAPTPEPAPVVQEPAPTPAPVVQEPAPTPTPTPVVDPAPTPIPDPTPRRVVYLTTFVTGAHRPTIKYIEDGPTPGTVVITIALNGNPKSTEYGLFLYSEKQSGWWNHRNRKIHALNEEQWQIFDPEDKTIVYQKVDNQVFVKITLSLNADTDYIFQIGARNRMGLKTGLSPEVFFATGAANSFAMIEGDDDAISIQPVSSQTVVTILESPEVLVAKLKIKIGNLRKACKDIRVSLRMKISDKDEITVTENLAKLERDLRGAKDDLLKAEDKNRKHKRSALTLAKDKKKYKKGADDKAKADRKAERAKAKAERKAERDKAKADRGRDREEIEKGDQGAEQSALAQQDAAAKLAAAEAEAAAHNAKDRK